MSVKKTPSNKWRLFFTHKVLILVLLTILVLIVGIVGSYLLNANRKPSSENSLSSSSKEDTGTIPFAKGMVVGSIESKPKIDLDTLSELVNAQRQTTGLAPLLRDELLDKSAQDKCQDMVTKNYWSHNAPDGTEPWDFIKKYNIYRTAGENLAYGFDTAQDVVNGWMRSPGHRENILKNSYTNVGYATCLYNTGLKAGEILVVQFFSDDPTKN